mgnify:CR=1 FL=1
MYSVDLVYRWPIYYIDGPDRFQYIEIDHYEQLTKRIGLIYIHNFIIIDYYEIETKTKKERKKLQHKNKTKKNKIIKNKRKKMC